MSTSRLANLLKNADRVLVFTGAGMSTGSGIPDFRGPQGVWKRRRPVYYDEFMTSYEARVLHWDFKLEGWLQFRDAKPNQAHLALSELDQMGRLDALVTQNIDGLHQLAGHPEGRVIELHGTNREIQCQTCGKRMDPDPIFAQFERTRKPPLCECGGFFKPATISFGQAMPYDKLTGAFAAASRADLVLAIGSTLEVEPAASIPRSAKEHGALYVIINQGTTAQDHLADLRVEGDATAVLPDAVDELRKLLGR
ncbi:Sir2 family NAD-dependent protein deacetylase [Acidobacteria bacterium AH-259-A15]|nr:Sir2 family NAD-dependent protein deacetylase [Acidobacteria bacterium AH-259-A15]